MSSGKEKERFKIITIKVSLDEYVMLKTLKSKLKAKSWKEFLIQCIKQYEKSAYDRAEIEEIKKLLLQIFKKVEEIDRKLSQFKYVNSSNE